MERSICFITYPNQNIEKLEAQKVLTAYGFNFVPFIGISAVLVTYCLFGSFKSVHCLSYVAWSLFWVFFALYWRSNKWSDKFSNLMTNHGMLHSLLHNRGILITLVMFRSRSLIKL